MKLAARYVVPATGPVLEGGFVEVANSRILSVGRAPSALGADTIDFGDAIICPGFVNAHTHLELTDLAGRLPPGPNLIDWLQRLVQTFWHEPPLLESVQSAVRRGIAQSLDAGVTTIGDITRLPEWTREVLADSPMMAVSFGEVAAIGRRRHVLHPRLEQAADRTRAGERLTIGISPHAPYTVEPAAMTACAERAKAGQFPLCIHLAETPDETEFTQSAQGPLADHLRTLGVWDSQVTAAGCGPVELAARTGLLTRRTLIAHANYVANQDIGYIAAVGSSVAYCPRTHAAFGHEPHRFREMHKAGINVCVGTDSLASNPSLSVLDELRFLHRRFPDVPAERLLAMGTACGARALGLGDKVGTLQPGCYADVTVLPLGAAGEEREWQRIFDRADDPLAVYTAGVRWTPDATSEP